MADASDEDDLLCAEQRSCDTFVQNADARGGCAGSPFAELRSAASTIGKLSVFVLVANALNRVVYRPSLSFFFASGEAHSFISLFRFAETLFECGGA